MLVEQLVSSPPRRIGEAGRGLLVKPVQNGVRQTKARRFATDEFGLCARLSAQLMINCCDRNYGQTRIAPRLPLRRENEQRHAVGPAGNRQDDMVEPCETREGGVGFNIGDRRIGSAFHVSSHCHHWHPMRWRSDLSTRLHTLSRIGKF